MKRLTRSNTNKVFSGILGGLGDYFSIDATIFRIAYVIFGFTSPFTSLIVYGIASIIIPEDDGVIYQDDYDYNHSSKDNSAVFIGIGLILLGIMLLARIYLPSFHVIFPSFRQIISRVADLWPVLLILLGVYVIFKQRKNY